MPGEVRSETTFMMTFIQLNAGIDGVHHPGNIHEIGETRATALADDNVAMYAVKEKQDEHARDVERARDVNRKRTEAGRLPMPVRMALKDGAETADYRPLNPVGLPPGMGPSALEGLNWRDVQDIADMLRAREEGKAGPHDPTPTRRGQHGPHGGTMRDAESAGSDVGTLGAAPIPAP